MTGWQAGRLAGWQADEAVGASLHKCGLPTYLRGHVISMGILNAPLAHIHRVERHFARRVTDGVVNDCHRVDPLRGLRKPLVDARLCHVFMCPCVRGQSEGGGTQRRAHM